MPRPTRISLSLTILGMTLAASCAAATDADAPAAEAIGVSQSALSTATTYTITAVQPLRGDANTYAFAINDQGVVTGVSTQTLQTRGHAIRVSATGAVQDLGTLPTGPYSVGLAINDSNQVAGNCYDSSINFHGCLYTDGKGWLDLGVLNVGNEDPTTQASSAAGIDSTGRVTGTAPWLDPVSFSQFNHAYLYAAGKKTDLRSLIGADGNSTGAAINDAGMVAGSSSSASGPVHAALWNGATITDLGVVAGGKTSGAAAINLNGHVAGTSSRPNCSGYQCSPQGFDHAFFYSSTAGIVDLGTLGGVSSHANGIDANDNVVGSSTASGTTAPKPGRLDPNRLAVLYSGGQVVDLNTRISATGWVLRDATGINAKGQIVGNGVLNGVPLGFVLTPK